MARLHSHRSLGPSEPPQYHLACTHLADCQGLQSRAKVTFMENEAPRAHLGLNLLNLSELPFLLDKMGSMKRYPFQKRLVRIKVRFCTEHARNSARHQKVLDGYPHLYHCCKQWRPASPILIPEMSPDDPRGHRPVAWARRGAHSGQEGGAGSKGPAAEAGAAEGHPTWGPGSKRDPNRQRGAERYWRQDQNEDRRAKQTGG